MSYWTVYWWVVGGILYSLDFNYFATHKYPHSISLKPVLYSLFVYSSTKVIERRRCGYPSNVSCNPEKCAAWRWDILCGSARRLPRRGSTHLVTTDVGLLIVIEAVRRDTANDVLAVYFPVTHGAPAHDLRCTLPMSRPWGQSVQEDLCYYRPAAV